MQKTYFIYFFLSECGSLSGTWVAQAVKHLDLGSGRHLANWFVSLSYASSSVLTMKNLFGILSVSPLSPCPYPACSLSQNK